MPAAGCTPADRATNRCRSTCGSYLRRRIPLLQRGVAGVVQALAAPGGLGWRCADAVLHALPAGAAGARGAFLAGHAAPLRRDYDRLAARARPKPTRCRLAQAQSPAPATPSTSMRSPATSASRASSPTASMRRPTAISRRRSCMPCALAMVHLSRLAEDLIIFCGDEYRFLRAVGCAEHRQQHDAAEEESGSAGAGARQDRVGPSDISSRC